MSFSSSFLFFCSRSSDVQEVTWDLNHEAQFRGRGTAVAEAYGRYKDYHFKIPKATHYQIHIIHMPILSLVPPNSPL
jgi:hypothetical protein